MNNTLPTSRLWKSLFDHVRPYSNTGLKFDAMQQLQGEYKDYPLQETIMILTDEGPKPVLIRRPAANEVAVVDWLNVTISKETFYRRCKDLAQDEADVACIEQLNAVLKDILGFGTCEELPRGKNYYNRTFALENECGSVSIGGQNDTILIMLTGNGCSLANYGWEHALYKWLKTEAVRPKITRIDYAHDDLTGDLIGVEWADSQDDIGGFNSGGRNPEIGKLGDWKRPNGTGRTFTVGKRVSSKYCRIYEKGRQLGDVDSPWVRAEVEYKAKHYHLPLEALINASEHFLAAYPCFHVFDSCAKPQKFEVKVQEAEIIWEKAIQVTRHQFSKYLKAFRDYYDDDSTVLDMLMPDPDNPNQYPKRLKLLTVPWQQSMPDPVYS